MPDWLTRWLQTDEDELLDVSQEEDPEESQPSPWPPHPQAWVRSSLRQMAHERWGDALEEEDALPPGLKPEYARNYRRLQAIRRQRQQEDTP